MSVDTPHRTYKKGESLWTRARDTFAGSDAIKMKGVSYLPMIEGLTQGNSMPVGTSAEYAAYVQRALFYPAVARTVAGLTGIVFAKKPTVTGVPVAQQEEFKDLTLTGVSLGSYGLQLTQEDLIVGRAGTLVDYASDGNRPYAAMYDAESVFNWRSARIKGVDKLVLLVLREEYEVIDEKDEFTVTIAYQYRVLRLEDNQRYTVQIYKEEQGKQGTWVGGEIKTPLRRGQPLDFIPFVFLGPSGIQPDIEHGPLQDLIDVNLSHYRTSADREHGLHFVSLPTPYVTGYQLGTNDRIGIGPTSVINISSPDAKVGMLEYSGAGLDSVKDNMIEKQQLMATLGARMLESQKNAQESAQAIKLRHTGERSALSVLAEAVGQHLTQVVRWYLWWAGRDTNLEKVIVTMNPDSMDELSAEDVKTLVTAWQAGAISKRTVYENLVWGEWARPGVTFEQEEEEIKREEPELDVTKIPAVEADDE